MIQFRLAHFSDALELKELNDLVNGEDSSTVEMIEKSLVENNQEIVCVATVIAGNTNKLVGFCCGQVIKSMCYANYGDIIELFVIEEYRRQDIEKQLIVQMEYEFDKRGVNHLHHFTGKDNQPMQELFISLGYVYTSEDSYGSTSLMIFGKDTDKRAK